MINQEIHKLLNEEHLKDNNFTYGYTDGRDLENSVVWFEYEFPEIGRVGIQHSLAIDLPIDKIKEQVEFLKSEEQKQSIIKRNEKRKQTTNG